MHAGERSRDVPGAGVAGGLSARPSSRPRLLVTGGVAVGRAAGGLRLRLDEPAGRGHRVGRVGAEDRRRRGTLRVRRTLHGDRRSRSSRPSRPRSGGSPRSRTSRASCRCCRTSRRRSWRSCTAWATSWTASSVGLARPLDLRGAHRGARDLEAPTGLRERAPRWRRAPGGDPRHRGARRRPCLARLQGPERRTVEIALGRLPAAAGRAISPSSGGGSSVAARPTPLTLGDLPDELRRKFIGKSGHLLLQVYSRLDVWDRPSQARFVEESADRRSERHGPAGRGVRVDAAHRDGRSASGWRTPSPSSSGSPP